VKADFLRALAKKGETPAEIAAFVQEFFKLAVDPGIDRAKLPGPMLDVVGTGGDSCISSMCRARRCSSWPRAACA
jgi:anthranilate phosphoribosyltransferase